MGQKYLGIAKHCKHQSITQLNRVKIILSFYPTETLALLTVNSECMVNLIHSNSC